MDNRDVTVTFTVKASQIDETRHWVKALQEFPAYAWHYADAIAKLMTKEDASADDGAELAKLVEMLKLDCVSADTTVKRLTTLVQDAVIHDPKGRKERLQ